MAGALIMWMVINIVILIAGVMLIGYAFYEDQKGSEQFQALLPFFLGAVFIIAGIVSSGIKHIWF